MKKDSVLPEWFESLKYRLEQSWLRFNVDDVARLSELSQDQVAFFMEMVKVMQGDLPESQLAEEIVSLGPKEVEEKVTAIDVVIKRSQRVCLQFNSIHHQVNQNPTEHIRKKSVHIGVQYNFFGTSEAANRSASSLKLEAPFTGNFGLPPVFRNFTGRVDILLTLSDCIGEDSDQNHSRVIVTGTGGVGKTQVVLYYAYQKLKEYRETQCKTGFRSVIWLIAGTDEEGDNRGFMSEQFSRLGEQLGFNPKEQEIDELVPRIYQRLEEEQGPYLVVFDNAINFSSISAYLPPFSVPSIITTRNSHMGDWDASMFSVVSLGVFSEEDSLRYIKKILGTEYVEEQAKMLAKTIGNFPLALTQALAFISSERMAIIRYLEEFNQQKEGYLRLPPWQGDPYQEEKNPFHNKNRAVTQQEHNEQRATVWAVVQLALKKITDVNAIQILKVCSFMAPEAPIDIRLLTNWTANTLDCRLALTTLRRYSLIETVELTDVPLEDRSQLQNVLSCGSARIHQLVQEIVRLSDDSQVHKLILGRFVECVRGYYEIDTNPKENELRHELLYPHMLEIINRLILLNGQNEFRMQIAALNLYFGNICLDLGHNEMALKVYLSAEETYKALGEEKLLADVLTQLGIAYIRLDKYRDAESKLVESRKIKENIYEQSHLKVAETLNSLGIVLRCLGNPEDSITLLKRALEIRDMNLSSDYVEVASTKMSLGVTYLKLGQFEPAIEYLVQALSIEEQAYGEKHPAVAGTLANLGVAYYYSGRYDESKKILDRALAIEERAYGNDHGYTAKTRVHRASVLASMGQIVEASIELKNSVQALKQKFSANNDFTFNAIGLLVRLETKLIAECQKIPEATDWLVLAENCFYVGLISISLRLAEQALGCEITLDALFLRARCQMLLCDFQNASDTVALIQTYRDKSDTRIEKLLKEFEELKLDAAQCQAKIDAKQLKLEPDIRDIIITASCLCKLHCYEQALSILKKVIMCCDQVELLAPAKFIQAKCYYFTQSYSEAKNSAEISSELQKHKNVNELLLKIKIAEYVHENLEALFAHLQNSSPRVIIF